MGYATTTSLSSASLLHDEDCNFLTGVGCGRGWGGARKRLMALSVKTVIVRCRWASQSSVADGCVHVPATYQLKPAVGEEVGRERQHRWHCVSLQLLSSDTRLIVHLSTTALSAARQLARSPCWPACLPAYPPALHVHHFSAWTARTCQKLRQPPRK